MGLREDMHQECVAGLPLRQAVIVGPALRTRLVIDQMREARLGCAYVVDSGGHPIGKFTERVLIRLLAEGDAGLDESVESHMVPVANSSVHLDDTIADAVRLMRQHGLRFLCVLDEEQRVVGLTGQKGVMEYLAEHFPRQIKSQSMADKLYMDQREGA